ncbi:MAG: hypothetical protein AAF753_02595 [Pseudomonadota bacterium]
MERLSVYFVAACLTVLMLGGCASTATGRAQSALLLGPAGAPAATPDIALPDAAALVVVRYPAVLDPEAEDAFYSAFVDRAIGGEVRSSVVGSLEARQAADGVLLKSSYFAQSIYSELSERLPEDSVLLSPHKITLDAAGALSSEPVTEAEKLPAVLAVDFVSYSFPDLERMMESEPLTFGDLFTPLVVVHSDHRAQAPTYGVMLASGPLVSASRAASHAAAMGAVAELESGELSTPVRVLDFVSHLNGSAGAPPATQGLALYSEVNAVQVYPIEKLLIDRFALRQIRASSNSQIDPLEDAFSAALAERIVAKLSGVDHARATMVARAEAIARFDPSLAPFALMAPPDKDVATRLQFADRMLAAERRFLATQSRNIHEGTVGGEIGDQMRDVLSAEFTLLERRRELARQQNMATAAAVAGVLAAGAIAAGSGDSFDAGEFIAVDLATDLAVISAMQAFNLNSQNKAAGVNFIQSMVPAMEEQITVQVELIESNEAISAIRFEDFQALLLERYAASRRSIDASASRCAFKGGLGQPIGAWQGECAAGVAEGVGVGVIRRPNGTVVEYYGSAVAGAPQGPGFMVLHRPSGSAVSMEGTFDAGRADGIVEVARPGQRDMTRIFDGGVDKGPAPPAQSVREGTGSPDEQVIG